MDFLAMQAFTGNTMTGAMTYSFINAIENKGAGATYGSLMHSIQWAIRNASLGIQGSGPISSLLKRVFGNGLAQVIPFSLSFGPNA